MKTYKEQSAEIQRLAARIMQKSKNFAKQTENPYYGDLHHIIETLQEADEFLNDKYLESEELTPIEKSYRKQHGF